MDKGLIKINELNQQISELQKGKQSNNNQISNAINAYKMLMIDIDAFEEKNTNLNEEKQRNLDAPQKRKKEKKELITSIILGYIMTTLIALSVVLIGSTGTVSILKCLLSSLALLAPVCAIAIPIEFKSINKKYPIGDGSKIEEQILLNNNKLKFLYSKKNELDNKLADLRKENTNLDEQISNLQKEINTIVSIRSNIIEEFCNHNVELDKMLDAAYDKEISEKQFKKNR